MKSNIIRQSFTSREQLRMSLGDRIISILKKAIKTKGKASLAVSGGNTPKKLFEYLSSGQLDWKQVTITLVDERWTDTSSEDSNEYLVRHHLLQNEAAKANFLGLKNDAATPYEAEEYCHETLCKAFEDDFDIVLLGMGEDGHTASFFPHADNLIKALTSLKECVAITPPHAPYQRMSLSLDRLLKTKYLFLHTEGERKFTVLNTAIEDGKVEDMPIRAFIERENKPYLEVFYAA